MAGSGQEGRPLQKRWLVLAAVVVLALIFLIPFIREGGARVDTNVVVETETAFVGDIQETTQGRGEIDAAQSTQELVEYTGKLAQVTVQEGDLVEQGDILALYDTEDLSAQIDSLLDELDELDAQIAQTTKSGSSEVTSEVSGLVKAVYIERGDIISEVQTTSGALIEISTDGLLQVSLTLSGQTELALGDEVTVQIGDASEPGEVAALEEQEDGWTVEITLADHADYALGTTVQVLAPDGSELGSGTLACNSPYLVQSEEGIISRVDVAVGDTVEQGQALFTRIETEYDELYLDLLNERIDLVDEVFQKQSFLKNPLLLADASGVVSELTMEAGTQVEAGEQVCSIISTDSFTLTVDILEEDIERVQVGQQVQLQFDEQSDTTYWGSVEKISLHSNTVGGLTLYPVTVSLTGAQGLEVGMAADATVILDSATDAVLVPVEAVQTLEDGSQVVEISYADGLSKVCGVETGLQNESYVQILSGVREGDEVVVASHLVETKVFSLFNFEWVIGQEEEPIQPASEVTQQTTDEDEADDEEEDVTSEDDG